MMAEKKTTFGLTLSNRALVTRGTPPKDLIDMAVAAEKRVASWMRYGSATVY